MKHIRILVLILLLCSSSFAGQTVISSLPFTFASGDHSGDPIDTITFSGNLTTAGVIGTISADDVYLNADIDSITWGTGGGLREANILNLLGDNIRVRGGYWLHGTPDPTSDSAIYVFDVGGVGVVFDSILYADLYGDGTCHRADGGIDRNGGSIIHAQSAGKHGLKIYGGVFESKIHAFYSRCWFNAVLNFHDLRSGANIGYDTLAGDTMHVIVDGAIISGPHIGIVMSGRTAGADEAVGVIRNCTITMDGRNDRYDTYSGTCFSAANPYSILTTYTQPGTRIHHNTFNSGTNYSGSRGVLVQRANTTPENPFRIDHNTFNVHEGPPVEYASGLPVHHVRLRYGVKSVDVDSNTFLGTFDDNPSTAHTGASGHYVRVSTECTAENRRNNYDAFTLVPNHEYWISLGQVSYFGVSDSVNYTSDGTPSYQEVAQGLAAAINASDVDTAITASAQSINNGANWRLNIAGDGCKPIDVFSADPNLNMLLANALADTLGNVRIFGNHFLQTSDGDPDVEILSIVFDDNEYDSTVYVFENYHNITDVAYKWGEVNGGSHSHVIHDDTIRFSDTANSTQYVYELGHLGNNWDAADNLARDQHYLNGATDTDDILFSADNNYKRSLNLQSTLELYARGTGNDLPIVNAVVHVWDNTGDTADVGDALFNGVTDSGGVVSGIVTYYYTQRIASTSSTNYNNFRFRYVFDGDTVWTNQAVSWTASSKTDTADFTGVNGTGEWGSEGESTFPDDLSSVVIDSSFSDFEGELDYINIIFTTTSGNSSDSIVFAYGTSGYLDSSAATRTALGYISSTVDTVEISLTMIETDTLYVSYWTKTNEGLWTSRGTVLEEFMAVIFAEPLDTIAIDSVHSDFVGENDSIGIIVTMPSVDWGDSCILTWSTVSYTDSFPTQSENRAGVPSDSALIDTVYTVQSIEEDGSLYVSGWIKENSGVWSLRTQSTRIFYAVDPDSTADVESPSKIEDFVIIKNGVIIIRGTQGSSEKSD